MSTVPQGVDRPDQPLPTPTDQAQSRRHFRARSNPGPPPDVESRNSATKTPADTTPLPLPPMAATEDADDVRRRLHDSLSRLPVKTRVKVHYPRDDTWWTGTITKSWLPRWRLSTKKPAHHVWVEYDDPRYTEPFEHNVAESVIEPIDHETAQPANAELAPLDLDNGRRARMLRLQRKLSY